MPHYSPTPVSSLPLRQTLISDLIAGLVVFLVALPLCLGIALASQAPELFSGIITGVIGGIVVGILSKSHTSVSGPAAGLTAIVAAQITEMGSYRLFLLAVVIAGFLQILLGWIKAGYISSFFPSSVIRGLLAAIGIILILKQVPHMLGHDTDPEGEMSFNQPDQQNTFSEFLHLLDDFHPGACIVGLTSLAMLLIWDRIPKLKKSVIPAPLVVVIAGVLQVTILKWFGKDWAIDVQQLVQVPIATSINDFVGFFTFPAFEGFLNLKVYSTAITIALVASLETLINIEAVDRLDPKQRITPPNRELMAQGIGNICCGMIGGLPLTSVVIRSSVNISAGGKTKFAAIFHGILLVVCVVALPHVLNQIPISALAAILIMTGYKLASPDLVRQMWSEGKYQFLPFALTVIAIVTTDLLTGVLIGMGTSVAFVLASNVRRPIRTVVEKHLSGQLIRIELANQVSFLNRAALDRFFENLPSGSRVLIDASQTDYIDPDVLSLIRQFKNVSSVARGIEVSLQGFRQQYELHDDYRFVDYTSRDVQDNLTPDQVLEILKEGNERFRTDKRLVRNLGLQVALTSAGQHPIAVILSCIDSRSPAEIIFDLGLGDIFSVRIAGNVISPKVLGSIEFGCAIAGAKLVLVLGHTKCGAVGTAVKFAANSRSVMEDTGCEHLGAIVSDIRKNFDAPTQLQMDSMSAEERESYVNDVTRRNIMASVQKIASESQTLHELMEAHRIKVVGALYDVNTGAIELLDWPNVKNQRVGVSPND